MSRPFRFKQFTIRQEQTSQKVGTDGVLLGCWARGGRRILDIGTGTGLIALMMAQRFPRASVVGIDIEQDAASEARRNVADSPWADRIEVLHCALADYLPGEPFDAIVSNPPFFVDALRCPDAGRTVARHAVTLTLDELVEHSARLLGGTGTLSVILPYDQLESMTRTGREHGLHLARQLSVSTTPGAEPKRVLLEFGPEAPTGPVDVQHITLEDGHHGRSRAYAELARDFYLSPEELAAHVEGRAE